MKRQNYIPLRIMLWLIAVYHIVAGVAATFFQQAAVQVGSLLFGVSINMDSQSELLVRYLGAFAIAFGFMAGLAAIAPERNRTFIWGAVVYFWVRAFDRIAFASLLAQHAVGSVPNWWRIVVILCFAAGLIIFLPKNKNAAETGAPAA